MKMMIALAAAGAAFATTAQADLRYGVYSDSNKYYLDYKTDLSEARRELRSDLARANDQADRIDAWAEYRQEVADARHDFAKEMAERGVTVRRFPSVTVEPN
jgi:hypothetical protein